MSQQAMDSYDIGADWEFLYVAGAYDAPSNRERITVENDH